MGSDQHYPEEAPSHRVQVDGFWMDRTPVTNADFQKFIEATGYVTLAQLPTNAEDYPGALPEMPSSFKECVKAASWRASTSIRSGRAR